MVRLIPPLCDVHVHVTTACESSYLKFCSHYTTCSILSCIPFTSFKDLTVNELIQLIYIIRHEILLVQLYAGKKLYRMY